MANAKRVTQTPGRPLITDDYGRLGEGLRVRLSRIEGETPNGVLPDRIYLPAVVSDMVLEEVADFAEFTTHRRGEFSVPMQGGSDAVRLQSLPFDFLTLDWDAPWLVEWRDPDLIKEQLQQILRGKRAVELLVLVKLGQRRVIEWRGGVTFRRTQETLKGGEPDTRYWTLEMKQWRSLTGARATSSKPKSGKRLPTKHKLDSNDTLESLSRHYYGTYLGWKTIRTANQLGGWGQRTPIVRHKRFKVGDSVKIPAMPEALRTDHPGGGLPGEQIQVG